METILSMVAGGVGGTILVWLLKGWISERLKQSIQHEYSQKLETHKAELDTKIQAIQNENQLYQLKTSLFFDHQRNAFARLLTKIGEVNQLWIDKCSVMEEGLTGPVPYDAYKDLQKAYYEHQLFLDSPCIAAMELVFECYSNSFPFIDGSGESTPRDANAAYEGVEYLQPRIAALFQKKIGVSNNNLPIREIALYGAILLLNRYSFPEVQLPAKEPLKLKRRCCPADAVSKAEENVEMLISKLKELHAYIRKDSGFFHEAAMKITRYLEMLDSEAFEKR